MLEPITGSWLEKPFTGLRNQVRPVKKVGYGSSKKQKNREKKKAVPASEMPPAKGFTGSLPEVGRKYWFLHPKESWIVGKVLKIEDEKSGLVKMKPDEIYDNQNPPLEEAAITADDNTMHMFSEMDINNDLDNLLNMAELHEGPLLHLVKSRFLKDQIYVSFSSFSNHPTQNSQTKSFLIQTIFF